MAAHNHLFPIEKMSKVFGVSRSGYYSWLGRAASRRTLQNQRLKKQIRRVWIESGKRYGSPRIHRQLQRSGYHVVV